MTEDTTPQEWKSELERDERVQIALRRFQKLDRREITLEGLIDNDFVKEAEQLVDLPQCQAIPLKEFAKFVLDDRIDPYWYVEFCGWAKDHKEALTATAADLVEEAIGFDSEYYKINAIAMFEDRGEQVSKDLKAIYRFMKDYWLEMHRVSQMLRDRDHH